MAGRVPQARVQEVEFLGVESLGADRRMTMSGHEAVNRAAGSAASDWIMPDWRARLRPLCPAPDQAFKQNSEQRGKPARVTHFILIFNKELTKKAKTGLEMDALNGAAGG